VPLTKIYFFATRHVAYNVMAALRSELTPMNYVKEFNSFCKTAC